MTTLNLAGNGIGAPGAERVAVALEQNTGLTTLNLEGNAIGAEGAQHLAAALEQNRKEEAARKAAQEEVARKAAEEAKKHKEEMERQKKAIDEMKEATKEYAEIGLGSLAEAIHKFQNGMATTEDKLNALSSVKDLFGDLNLAAPNGDVVEFNKVLEDLERRSNEMRGLGRLTNEQVKMKKRLGLR